MPAAQTVSALPRELLIAEGLRTLLIPLLLGGAIAILTYLSGRRDWGVAKAEGDTDAPDPIDTALEATQRAGIVIKEASRRIADLRRVANEIQELEDLPAEKVILREAKLSYAIQDARDRLTGAVAA